jgi:phosphate transport system substrate-binding protein
VEIVLVPSLGSAGGIKALAAGAIDVALSGRPVKDEERAKGVEPREWVRSPFVFAVHLASPTDAVTLDHAVAVYAGMVTTWPDGTPLGSCSVPRPTPTTTSCARSRPPWPWPCEPPWTGRA